MPGSKISPGDGEYRIVVIGREGHGKSTVCNALVGKDHFAVGTKTTSCDVAECSKGPLKIKVVDTPDISDNDMKQKDKDAEVNKWKELAGANPNVILLCIRGDATYTERDFIAYRQVRRFWGGRNLRSRLVLIFTFCEGQDVEEVGDRMESGSPKWIGKAFKNSRGRYVVFKGKTSGNFLDEIMDDSDDEEEEEGSPRRKRSRSPKGGRKGKSRSRSRSRSPKGSRKGRSRSRSPKGSRKGSRSRSRSPKGSRKGSGKSRGRSPHKPKGGRCRRRGHSGKRRGQHRGFWAVLCCCCRFICKN